jgi:protein-tyrosine phosphatase
VRQAVASAGLPLEVRPGGEIAIDRIRRLSAEERSRFGLGGNPDYLLVEFPYYGWSLELAERLFELREVGITTVLAHPERNSDVQARPELLQDLVDAGTLVQITAASVDGRFGRRTRVTALRLLELRLAHLLASDAHAPGFRATGLSAAAASLEDDALARWLTVDVPRAILRGEPLPERTDEPKPKRGWLTRLRATF